MRTFVVFSLCLLGLGVTEAGAADFTGRIRRIRIRENQSDTTFRAVVVTEGDTSPVDTTVSITAEDEDSGAIVEASGSLTALRRLDTLSWTGSEGAVSAFVTLSDGTNRYAAKVAVGERTEVALTSGDIVLVGIEAPTDFTTLSSGESTATYTLTAELVGTKADGVTAVHKAPTYTASVATDDTGKVVLASGKVFDGSGETWTGRWASGKLDGEDFGGRAALSARWRDYGDRTLDEEDDSLVFLGVAEGTALVEAKVGKVNDNGVQRLTLFTVGFPDAAPEALDVTVEDEGAAAELASETLTQAVETTAIFNVPAFDFDPTGKLRAEVVVVTGDEEVSVGAVVVPTDGSVVANTPNAKLALNLHKLAVYENDDGTAALSFSLHEGRGSSYGVDDVQVIVLLTASGCDPTSRTCTATEYDAAPESSFQRWVMPFQGDADATSYTISADVRGVDGEIIDGTVFEVSARFGTGTRSTAGQASQKTELL